MDARRRQILEGVKDKTYTPEEALRLLTDLQEAPPAPSGSHGRAGKGGSEIRLLRIRHEIGTVMVRGDPSVAQYHVSGPHSVEQDGGEVVISGDSSFVGVGWVMGPGERRPRWRWPGKGQRDHAVLEVDVNPSTPIDVHVDAGRLRVVGMRAPVTAHVELGSLVVKDTVGPIDLKIESGTIDARGAVTGRSRISCELGKVIAHLDSASDVRVKAKCTLGSVSLGDGEPRRKRAGVGSAGELQVGDGSGELDIRVEAGSIRVGVDG